MGKIDDFIDDGNAVVPDLNDNKNRGVAAMLLAIHTLCRPLDPNAPILREDCLSLDKSGNEGTMSETPTILGWQVHTRLLTLALPEKKKLACHSMPSYALLLKLTASHTGKMEK